MQDDGKCGEETKNVISDLRACVASAKELNCTRTWRTSTVLCARSVASGWSRRLFCVSRGREVWSKIFWNMPRSDSLMFLCRRLASTTSSSSALPGERHSCDHVKKALVAAAIHIRPALLNVHTPLIDEEQSSRASSVISRGLQVHRSVSH